MDNEVFLLVDNTYLATATEVHVFKQLYDLNVYIDEYVYDINNENLHVLHGVILSANFLPHDFNSVAAYVYIRNPFGTIHIEAENEAHFEKVDGDPFNAASLIEELLNEESFQFDNGQFIVTIDDTFLFLGYELQITQTITEEFIDEEVMDRIKYVTKSINTCMTQFKKDNYET